MHDVNGVDVKSEHPPPNAVPDKKTRLRLYVERGAAQTGLIIPENNFKVTGLI